MRNFRNTTSNHCTGLLVLALAVLSTATTALATTIAYTDGGAIGNHTGATGGINIGREFSVTASATVTGIDVSALGIFANDASGNPLSFTESHVVDLFSIGTPGVANPTHTLLASVTVPAGTVAPYQNGFRFADLASPIFLAPGNYAVIAYGLNDGNAGYGDGNGSGRLNTANAHDLGFDPYELPTTNVSPTFPNNGDGGDHNGASFLFTPTPEPSTFVLGGLGLVGLFVAARRRRKA